MSDRHELAEWIKEGSCELSGNLQEIEFRIYQQFR